jgi:hypothetical protein
VAATRLIPDVPGQGWNTDRSARQLPTPTRGGWAIDAQYAAWDPDASKGRPGGLPTLHVRYGLSIKAIVAAVRKWIA